MPRDYFQDHSNVLFRGIQNDKLNSFRQKFRRLYVTPHHVYSFHRNKAGVQYSQFKFSSFER